MQQKMDILDLITGLARVMFLCGFFNVLPVYVRVFFPQSKDRIRSSGYFKLCIGVNVRVNGCLFCC